jgi:type I restriction enzyme S subunit
LHPINEYWTGNIPWLSVVDFNNDDRWVSNAEKSITKLGLQKSSTKLLKVGDIIIHLLYGNLVEFC